MNRMLSDEVQLGIALEAFSWAHSMDEGWSMRNLLYFKSAGINSMSDLQQGCKENTINLDLELFGIPIEEQLQEDTVQSLQSFLPGPVGFRCFRLAQKAALKVLKGTADTEYVHRPENGKMGEEEWTVPVNGSWTLNVDCAGFVRNCLKHVTKDKFRMLLSDRDFMRAKDFFGFFSTIPYTVMDKEHIPESDQRMKWRIVPDLRMVIPGDVIVYRAMGNAAGAAAFTTNDRTDLNHLLKAVRAAQLFKEMKQEWETMGSECRNVAKDPLVLPWVSAVKMKLKEIGITSVRGLRENLPSVNDLLKEKGRSILRPDTLELIKECAETKAMNTGHIVFAAGIAVNKGNNEYRIPVVHSTKFGKKDENGEVTTGVQQHFKRFKLVQRPDGTDFWSRNVAQDPALIAAAAAAVAEDTSGAVTDDEIDNPMDDMDDDDVDDVDPVLEDPAVTEDVMDEVVMDDVGGQSEVHVLAARMWF